MSVAAVPSVGCERFELFLLLPMAAVVVVLGVEVLVSAWAVWAAPALACKVVHPTLYTRASGDNYGLPG